MREARLVLPTMEREKAEILCNLREEFGFLNTHNYERVSLPCTLRVVYHTYRVMSVCSYYVVENCNSILI